MKSEGWTRLGGREGLCQVMFKLTPDKKSMRVKSNFGRGHHAKCLRGRKGCSLCIVFAHLPVYHLSPPLSCNLYDRKDHVYSMHRHKPSKLPAWRGGHSQYNYWMMSEPLHTILSA